jgi:hypothetical protein
LKTRIALITPHQGLGDHILCNGLYRHFSQSRRHVIITVKQNYVNEIRYMLRDCPNIKILPLPLRRSWTFTRLIQIISRPLPIEIVGLGSYGINFFPMGVRFDQNFYDQAGMDFDFRWSKFKVPRDDRRENEIFELLGCHSGPYVFLHEDKNREFVIDRKRIDSKLKIVEPIVGSKQFSLFDYRKVLEGASEIHLIESSFAAFAESINLTQKLYAHRYARGHALYDFRHEFTYRSNWNVLI